MGECYYCRDGKMVELVRVTTGYVSGGDWIPEDEYVCGTCAAWMQLAPLARNGSVE
jgi:hypothetical protein